jgi:FkbM family methyltransferase
MSSNSLKRIIHKFKWILFQKLGTKSTIIKTDLGFKFKVDFNNVSAYFFYFEKYELEEIDLIKKYLKPGMTVLDIGANIGYLTLLMSNLVGPEGHVYSFEPNPTIYSRLGDNIGINPDLDDGRITTEKIALGASEDKMEFYCPINGHEGVGGLQDTKRAPLDKVIEVKVNTLDNFVLEHNIDRIDFIKMDVEGGEFDVIRGAKNTLKKMNPIILFEATELNTAPYGYKVKDFLQYLENEGFTVKPSDSENFIAIPRER